MKFRKIAGLLVVTVLTAGFASAEDSPDQQREKTRKMAAATLNGSVQASTRLEGCDPEVGGVRRLQQCGYEPASAQHGARCGHSSRLENPKGNLHENDLGGCGVWELE